MEEWKRFYIGVPEFYNYAIKKNHKSDSRKENESM